MGTSSADIVDIKRLREHLEKILGWGPSRKWHSSVYTKLSEKIFEQCRVSLSPTTLKRFWGAVNYEGNPNISTLDTLSQFGGYANWLDFKVAHQPNLRSSINRQQIPRKSLYITAGFFLALVIIALVSTRRPAFVTPSDPVPFSSKALSTTYPNSVVFDFDVSNIGAESFHIQQYWDKSKTVEISQDQSQATGIYYFPGYFKAELIADGTSVSQHDLFLKSEGWLGTIDYDPVPKYFTPVSGAEFLSYPAEFLDEVSNLDDPMTTRYHFVSDLGDISGDNLKIETVIRSGYLEKWAVCKSAQIIVLGTNGAMLIPFSTLGCSSDNLLMLNDTYYDGKKHDLSMFATDLSEYRQININVAAKKVDILIEHEVVYSDQYEISMGRFVGLRFKFLGLGEVQRLDIYDQDGSEVSVQTR